MNRAAEGKLKWVGTQYPTQAAAQDAEMSLEEYEDFVFGAGTIGAHQAELICDGYKQWLAQNPDKN